MRKIYSYIVCGALFFLPARSFAQWDVTQGREGTTIDDLKKDKFDLKLEPSKSVSLQADSVEYASGESVAKAHGNVVVTSGSTTITANQMELDRNKQEAVAVGNVYMDTPNLQMDADSGTYNFSDKSGQFNNARTFVDPFQIKGETITKDGDDHMAMENGFLTTCDHDKPHFRMESKRMDVYPGDKAVARGVKIYVGNVPVMYVPKFEQALDGSQWFSFVPGSKKDLGLFMLTRSRFKINPYWTTTILVDAYERQGFAWGSENKYTTPSMGSGMVRHYFINEREISTDHPWQPKIAPTVQNERYRLEWRHQWEVDDKTNAVMQYYRLSDNVILKKYFEREYRQDSNPSTYFLLTRALPVGNLSMRVDHRVNRFVSAIDRTPQVEYSLAGQPLGETGFYLKSQNSISNLVNRQASPTEDRRKTFRADTNNEISYPMHVSFVQFTPLVGGETTYYSRTIDPAKPKDIVRNSFKTGADLSARFMKVIDLDRGLFGSDITKLRHVLAPSVAYRYQHAPTFAATSLNQFDAAIDGLAASHVISFSLENKLQTKRKKQIVDLVRDLTTVDYVVQHKGYGGQLGPVKNLVEITPADWVRIVSETVYDHRNGHLTESNFDMYFTKANKFGFDIGDRFARGGNHQLVTQLAYVINPKWRFKIYDRFEINSGHTQEYNITVTRDLHEWEMGMILGKRRGHGNEILMSFTLKAFPGQPLDLFSTTFHERKAGATTDSN